jgi:hypothetical protein
MFRNTGAGSIIGYISKFEACIEFKRNLKRSYLNIVIFDVLVLFITAEVFVRLIKLKIPFRNLLKNPIEMMLIIYHGELL